MACLGLEMLDLMPDDLGTRRKATTRPAKVDTHPVLPGDLSSGTDAEHQQLALLRNVHFSSVQNAVDRGLIRFGTHKGIACWFVMDGTERNVQARRLDGNPFGNLKALTLTNSEGSWPIGIKAALPYQSIALVEGGPDLLAALSLAWEEEVDHLVAPVAMLGASHKIPAETLPLFCGRQVRIFPHLDEAGQQAGARWEQQLRRAGADVRCVSLANIRMVNGQPAKDLNDVCYVHADEFLKDRSLWHLFDFAWEAAHE